MKELYLIPKHVYDVMNSGRGNVKDNIDTNDNTLTFNKRKGDRSLKPKEKWVTRMLPPPIQDRITLKTVNTPNDNNDGNSKNPSLFDHLSLRIGAHEISRAKLILKHLEKSNKVLWDDHGDIYSMFR